MIIQRFESHVRENPGKLAIQTTNTALTYYQLDSLSNQIANSIRRNSDKPGCIGILVEEGAYMIAGMFAILKSGYKYVPMAGDFPVKRIQYIMDHAEIDWFITDRENLELVSRAAENRNIGYIIMEDLLKENLPTHLEFTREIYSDQDAYLLYTSGSTGFPKGVRQTHRNVLYFIDCYSENLEISANDNLTSLASYSHDVSTMDIYSALLNGATLFPLNLKKEDRLPEMYQWLATNQITIWHSVPTVFRYFIANLQNKVDLPVLRYVVLGGEAVSKGDIEKFYHFFSNCIGSQLYTLYGQTESSYDSGYKYPITVAPGEKKPDIEELVLTLGDANRGTEMVVLDEEGNEKDFLEVGEIIIINNHLSPGYWKDEQTTAKKFAEIESGERIHFTGDLGRRLLNGRVEFLGRKDYQVKIRGYRIELEEIENVVMQHGHITGAAVTAVESGSTHLGEREKFLACYFTGNRNVDIPALRVFLRDRLMEYMIPSYFKQVEKLPVTVSGKVDRKALPRPDISLAQDYVPPTDEIESKLVEIWSDVLHIGPEIIGVCSNFFELGGHSLRATDLTSRIHKEMQVKIPLAEVFERQTIRGLREYIRETEVSGYQCIEPVEKKEYYPMSPIQRQFYFLQMVDPDSPFYNIPYIFTMGETADKDQLENSCKELIRRHEILRTSFEIVSQEPVQRIHDPEEVDFRMGYVEGDAGELEKLFKSLITPFDLSRAPLIRLTLIRVTGENSRYILLVDYHHIIVDNTSLNLVEADYLAIYDEKPLPPMKIHYKDYSESQRGTYYQEELRKQGEYWLNRFSGELPVLNLPVDNPRPPQMDFSGDTVSFVVEAAHTRQLKEVAANHDVTLYMVMLTGFIVLLSRLTNQEDIIVGTPTAGRRHAELQQLPGVLINILPMRNDISTETDIPGVMKKVKQTTLEAYENQEYPFEILVKNVSQPGDLSRNPVFDVMFNFVDERDFKNDTTRLNEQDLFHSVKETSRFDIGLIVVDRGKNIVVRFEYSSLLFKPETIERIIRYYKHILKTQVEQPGIQLKDLGIMSEQEKEKLLAMCNGPQDPLNREKTLCDLFNRHVLCAPDQVALTGKTLKQNNISDTNSANTAVTYHELNGYAQRVATQLEQKGVQPDTIVGIMVERSLEMIIGMMGIITSGGAYLPIEPGTPANRINYLLTDSGAPVLLSVDNPVEEIGCPVTQMDLRPLIYSSSWDDNKKIPIGRREGESESYPNKKQQESLAYVLYTSGTSGKPKGVMIDRHSVVNVNQWYGQRYHLGPGVHLLLMSEYIFDASVNQIFGSLVFGAVLHVIPKSILMEIASLRHYIQTRQINVINFVPVLLKELLIPGPKLKSIHAVISGAERLDDSTKDKIIDAGYSLYNQYGPTETTIDALALRCTAEKVTLGKPISNMNCFILDKNGHLSPIGVIGELFVSGSGIARGYLNNPELTSEKFYLRYSGGSFRENHPLNPRKSFSISHTTTQPHNHSTLYRTGDLTRMHENGNVEFLGRIDFQVKIRGFRIELEEIENQLLKHRDIKNVLVTAVQNGPDTFLCAYIIVGTTQISENQIKEFLSQFLPDYMIPGYFVFLEKFPLLSNGKIDRKSLPLPNIKATAGIITPGNELEKRIAGIWAEVLGVETSVIGITDNFFKSGGHSLKAIVLAANLHKAFNVKIPLAEIFKNPTVKAIAQYVQKARKDVCEIINCVEKKEYYPQSPAQKRLFFLNQFDHIGTSYNITKLLKLDTSGSIETLERILCSLIQRHETLRTSFHMSGGTPIQRIHDSDGHQFTIEQFEIDHEVNKSLEEIIRSSIRPFDLSIPPLLRVSLITANTTERLLLIDLHHIIADGMSIDILTSEFQRLYNAEVLEPLRIQYKEFSCWQNRLIETGKLSQQEQYWLEMYSGMEEVPRLNLPYDFARSAMFDFSGRHWGFHLGTQFTSKLKELGIQYDATLYMVLQTLLSIVIYKYTGQEDFIVGCGVAGRPYADLQPIVGMFVNMLPMRNHPNGNMSFQEFLTEVKADSIQAFENQEVQFEDLVDKLSLQRDLSRNPMFDVAFIVQNSTQSNGVPTPSEKQDNNQTGESLFSTFQHEGTTSKFDLLLQAVDLTEDIYIDIEYCTRLFKQETIRRFSRHFLNVIAHVIKQPKIIISEIDIVPEEEKHRLLIDFNRTAVPYPKDQLIHQLFFERTQETPDHVCLIGKGTASGDEVTITSGKIMQLSLHEAVKLKNMGIHSGAITGIRAERTIETIISILAILTSGGAYLPIEPDFPKERIAYMLTDSNAAAWITQASDIGNWDGLSTQSINQQWLKATDQQDILEDTTVTNQIQYNSILNRTHSSPLAYVKYTSGSTGVPKGVMVTHSNVLRLVINTNYIDFHRGDSLLQTGTLSFDAATFEIWGTLLNGLKLLLTGKETILDPHGLKETITTRQINIMWLTAPFFNQVLDLEIETFHDLDVLLLGGDTLSTGHVNRLLARFPEINVINGYGPTENTTFSTTFAVKDQFSWRIPIGKPISNSSVYIVDKNENPVPIGITGELWVGGDGVAQGYLNRPELTAKHFIFGYKRFNSAGEGIYKTGDLARWLPDGNIQFQGREDNQVKIRGFRIELGEIQSVLSRHPLIKDNAVLACDLGGETHVCAYIVVTPMTPGSDAKISDSFDPDLLKENLKERLPDYMIPSYFIQLNRIPLTPTGKVDRKSLPVPGIHESKTSVAPRSEIEKILLEIWTGIIGAGNRTIGIEDNFFTLGGHSLKAMALVAQLFKVFNVKIPLASIFQYPTIKEMAEVLMASMEQTKGDSPEVLPVELKEYYPLSFHQHRVYVLHAANPESAFLNMPFQVELRQEINPQLIATVLTQLIRRHESLRTAFKIVDELPCQVIMEIESIRLPLEFIDLSGMQPEIREQERTRIYTQLAVTPFDLAKAPLIRIALVKLEVQCWAFFFNMHHIISDGWSMEILKKELISSYENRQSENRIAEPPPLYLQYTDYAYWHNRWIESTEGQWSYQFWKQKLTEELPGLSLPRDGDVEKGDNAGAAFRFKINEEVLGKLKELAENQQVTVFTIMFSTYLLFLSKICNQNNIMCSVVSAGRDHPSLHSIIGFFVNSIIYTADIDIKLTFRELLKLVNSDMSELFKHQSFPLEIIFGDLEKKYPEMEAAFNLVNLADAGEVGTLESFTPIHLESVQDVKYHFEIYAAEYKNGIALYWVYKKNMFRATTIDFFGKEYIRQLEFFVNNPALSLRDYLALGKSSTPGRLNKTKRIVTC